MTKKLAVLSLLILQSIVTSSAIGSEILRIAVGGSIPPYIIEDENRGIEFDILKESLAFSGYEMEPIYVPLGRTLAMIREGQVDGIMSTGLTDLPGCYTDSHITYWNFAISVRERNLQIQSIDDLSRYSVLSFQNARNYLGDAFKKMAAENEAYREINDQSVQNKMLYSGRVDVVVADRFIFDWYRRDESVGKVVDTEQEIVFHALFEPSHFSSVFKDDAVCLAFNKGLAYLRSSGRYDEIIRTYGVAEPDYVLPATR